MGMSENENDGNIRHFNRQPVRKAEFIMPPNTLKAKVGSGGLAEEILSKAELLLEKNTADFLPLADMYLNSLQKGMDQARDTDTSALDESGNESVIAAMLYPAMQLKANGGMFRYPMVTRIADRLIQFLEVIHKADLDALEIVMAFHATIRAVVLGRIMGDGGRQGADLIAALDDACHRYFERNPNMKTGIEHHYVDSL